MRDPLALKDIFFPDPEGEVERSQQDQRCEAVKRREAFTT